MKKIIIIILTLTICQFSFASTDFLQTGKQQLKKREFKQASKTFQELINADRDNPKAPISAATNDNR